MNEKELLLNETVANHIILNILVCLSYTNVDDLQ